jgi:hypothetical protein
VLSRWANDQKGPEGRAGGCNELVLDLGAGYTNVPFIKMFCVTLVTQIPLCITHTAIGLDPSFLDRC